MPYNGFIIAFISEDFKGKAFSGADYCLCSSQPAEITKELKNIRSPKRLLYYFIHFEIVSDKIEPTKNRSKITVFHPKNTPKIFIENLG